MRVYRSLWFSLISMCLFCINSAMAGISLDSTRIVFSAANGAQGQLIGVTSSMQSSSPYLVKAQVLADVEGAQTQTVFAVAPSLFRLEPGTTNQLRVLKTGNQALPKDRESIFYLRVMALPAGQGDLSAPKAELGGAITVSTGSVIKLFYRPSGLALAPQQAMAALTFSRQGTGLSVSNPSPYFVTLSSLKIGGKSVPLSIRAQNTMIAPFGSITYPGINSVGQVTWEAINDFGGKELFHGTVQ